MKHYQFKTYHQNELEDWLGKNHNVSEFIRDTLDNVRTGKLVYKTELNLKEKTDTAKLKITEARADRIKEKESLQLRKLEAETEIIERQLTYHHTFGNSPSKKAYSAIKRGIENRPEITFDGENTNNYHIKKIGADFIGVCLRCEFYSTELLPTEYSCKHQLESHLIETHENGLIAK